MAVGSVRPIVVGIDGGPESQVALRWATEEASVRGLPVRVISVFEWPPTVAPEPAERVYQDAIAYVRDRLGTGRVTGTQVSGKAAEILVGESETAELLVVGSRSRSALAAVLLGSVSCAVAAHAKCSAMVVRSGRRGPDARRIVVGIDGSSQSDHALAFGFETAAVRDNPLEVVHCWQPVESVDPAVWTADRANRERENRKVWLHDLVAPYQEKYPNVDLTTQLVEGRPAALLAVRSWSAQLVVVGSRGHGGLVGLMLGSVSQGLLHHAHCSVAVVRGTDGLDADGSVSNAKGGGRDGVVNW